MLFVGHHWWTSLNIQIYRKLAGATFAIVIKYDRIKAVFGSNIFLFPPKTGKALEEIAPQDGHSKMLTHIYNGLENQMSTPLLYSSLSQTLDSQNDFIMLTIQPRFNLICWSGTWSFEKLIYTMSFWSELNHINTSKLSPLSQEKKWRPSLAFSFWWELLGSRKRMYRSLVTWP